MDIKRATSDTIRETNRSNIYKLLYKSNALSRQDIVRDLGLSLPTINQNIKELEKNGLIYKSGTEGGTGGRNAQVYDIVRNAKVAIGVDITKNHITTVIIDLLGNIIASNRLRKKFERNDNYYKLLGEIIESLIDKNNIDREKILGIGIGVPGLITVDGSRVFYGEILNFTDATVDEFSMYIPYRSMLVNDAKAAGFAEVWTDNSLKDAFYLMLSNNVGGSFIMGGKVYRGDNIRAGEIGHLTIHNEGKQCYCGQKGCYDPYGAATVLSKLTDGNLEEYFDNLEKGDKQARDLWEKYLYNLAIAVNNLNILLDCNIIIGGYVGEYFDPYLDELKNAVAQRNSFTSNLDFIKTCKYKTESIAAGSALYYVDNFVKQI